MYKLLLVEDEEEVRKGIVNKIDWEKYGFQIIGEADNGRDAIDIIERTVPDIVITDIRMPFMDGLELCQYIKEKYPLIKVILLTGFDEFKYAQQAIKLNIMEYILKPISSEELTTCLIRIKDKVDMEMAQRKDMEALREYYIKSLPVMRDKFLTSLITTRQKKEDIISKVSDFNVKLKGEGFATSVISINGSIIENKVYSKDDIELFKIAICNISEEIVEKHFLGVVFMHSNFIVIIFAFDSFEKELILDKTFKCIDEIRQNIEKYLKLSVTIGIGNICCDISSISDSFKNAVSALDYRFIISNNRIIYIEDLEPQYMSRIIFDEVKEHMLTSTLKVGTREKFSLVIDILFNDITDTKASFSDYQMYLLEILACIVKVSKSLALDMGTVSGHNYNLFEEMFKFNTIDDVKNWFKDIGTRLIVQISGKRQDVCELIVEKARDYVKANYSDNDISITKVCHYLHISPSYFSALFKRETGETFINYLIKVRMDLARDLLSTTRMKTFEIAEKVGYLDHHYFSYCYKKYFNISPTGYRNSLINGKVT